MKLHIGNLHESTTESDLKNVFSHLPGLVYVVISKDKDSGLSNGFGFIEFESKRFGYAAISKINGKNLNGSKITVNEARKRHNQYLSKQHRRWQEF